MPGLEPAVGLVVSAWSVSFSEEFGRPSNRTSYPWELAERFRSRGGDELDCGVRRFAGAMSLGWQSGNFGVWAGLHFFCRGVRVFVSRIARLSLTAAFEELYAGSVRRECDMCARRGERGATRGCGAGHQ
jgi:hypothetical protein